MNLEFNIPTDWNQLTERQRWKISDLIYNTAEGSKGVYFAALYYLFCPNKTWSRSGLKEHYKFLRLVLQVPFSSLLPHISFLFTGLNLHKFPKYVTVRGVKYYGPADRLSNLTIEEFNFAYKFFFDWAVSKDPSALDRLVTAIYRPARKKKRGDIRELFDIASITARGNVFPKLATEEKLAIGMAFRGSVDYMFSKYTTLFPTPKVKKKDDSKPKYQSMVPMINAMFMGENQPLGPRKDAVKTNVYVFFDVAQETVIANKELERKLKK